MQGRTLLHYHFLEKLGEGGMGQVYKARDQSLGRLVAIKVLPGDGSIASSRSRFFREARTASSLNHPNIITIHEIASCEGTEMIVMEHIEGIPSASCWPVARCPLATCSATPRRSPMRSPKRMLPVSSIATSSRATSWSPPIAS